MPVRRSPHRRAAMRKQAAEQASKPNHFRDMLQDLKVLDIKRRAIGLHKRRMPYLIAGLLPIGLTVLFFVLQASILSLWLGIAIGGGYASQFFGPLGSLTRIKKARLDGELQIMKITERLPLMETGEALALFGVQKAGKSSLVTSDGAIRINRETLEAIDTDMAFVALGKYQYLGTAHIGANGSISEDFDRFKDQYWLGYARQKGCGDEAIAKALTQLRLK